MAPHFVQYLLMLFDFSKADSGTGLKAQPGSRIEWQNSIVFGSLRRSSLVVTASCQTHAHTHDYYEQHVANDKEKSKTDRNKGKHLCFFSRILRTRSVAGRNLAVNLSREDHRDDTAG
jgi:hypothetical protein